MSGNTISGGTPTETTGTTGTSGNWSTWTNVYGNTWITGGTGESSKKKKATVPAWSNAYTVDNAPSWWQGLVPSKYTPDTSYLALINALIPTMSPEDQKSTGTYLATAFPTIFPMYNPATATNYTPAPSAMTPDIQKSFQSVSKADQTLDALDKLIATMSVTTGKKKAVVEKNLGAGYTYLRSIANTMKQYAGKSDVEQQTRRQYMEQAAQLDPLLALGKTDALSAYAPIAQKIAQPYFTAGQLTPLVNGKFGTPNKQLFG